jgi:MFS family permease
MRAASQNGTEIVIRKARSFSHFSDSQQCNFVNESGTETLQTLFIAVTFLSFLADNLLLTICIPIVPNLLDEKYGSIAIGCIFSAKPLVQLLTNLFASFVVDRRGPKLPLLIGVFILTISAVLFGYALSLGDDLDGAYSYLVISRLLHGCASSFILGGGMSLVAMTHGIHLRHKAVSISISGIGCGVMLGPPLGGLSSYYIYNWFACIPICIILLLSIILQLCIYNGGYITFVSDSNNDDESEIVFSTSAFGITSTKWSYSNNNILYSGSYKSFFKIISNSYVMTCFNVAFLSSIIMGMMEPLLPSYLKDTFQYDILTQSLIIGMCTVLYIISTYVHGTLCDKKYSKYLCIFINIFILGISLSFFAFSLSSAALTIVALFLLGWSVGGIEAPTLPFLADIIEVRYICNYVVVFMSCWFEVY